jgi:hypothetical protein
LNAKARPSDAGCIHLQDIQRKRHFAVSEEGLAVPHRYAHEPFRWRTGWRASLGYAAMLLMACMNPAQAMRASSNVLQGQASGELSIQVNDDRLTLQVTKVPQVYIYGTIDANAPGRLEAMVKSGKIPNGSDIYLNSTGGDISAGIALGRLFRSGSMVTHLGTPRPKLRSASSTVKTAICSDACAYAYLGGFYRWAPAGSDRIGFPMHYIADPKPGDANQNETAQAPDQVASYLHDMGINSKMLAQSSSATGNGEVWLNADQMLATGLANNGRLFLSATYRLESGAPFLELKQTDRNGEHRITMLCKRGNIDLAAYSTVGAMQARQVVSHGVRSYFELNQKELLPAQTTALTLDNDTVVLNRTFPANQLTNIVHAQALGAWVTDRNSAFRYGFAYEVTGVKESLQRFYDNCWIYAPWADNKENP